MSRFKDENLTLYYFSEKVLVHCPKCQGKAEVNNHLRDYSAAELFCKNCGYYAKNNNSTP